MFHPDNEKNCWRAHANGRKQILSSDEASEPAIKTWYLSPQPNSRRFTSRPGSKGWPNDRHNSKRCISSEERLLSTDKLFFLGRSRNRSNFCREMYHRDK